MKTNPLTNPKDFCEALLQEEKNYNVQNRILPSETAVVERLLERSVEMADAYRELWEKLRAEPPQLKVFLGLVLSVAAFWSPERVTEALKDRKELTHVNQEIAKVAASLAKLLAKRSEIENTSGFGTNTHYSMCDVIESASKENHLFNFWVKEGFQTLHGQFDLKYWPTLDECLSEIATDAKNAVSEPSDAITAAATNTLRSTRSSFFRALFAAIEENTGESGGLLPRNFTLTDNTLATIANCALDLTGDLVDGPFVKRLRQRERQQT